MSHSPLSEEPRVEGAHSLVRDDPEVLLKTATVVTNAAPHGWWDEEESPPFFLLGVFSEEVEGSPPFL